MNMYIHEHIPTYAHAWGPRALISVITLWLYRFYERYPQHVKTVHDIVAHLDKSPVRLPGGGILTSRRFLHLGLCLGGGGGFEHLHYLLERPWASEGQLSYEFLRRVEAETSFDTNPIYALLHEAIYCSGKGQASRWSAKRTMPPHFDHAKALQRDSSRVYFFGEHCFPCVPTPKQFLSRITVHLLYCCAECLALKSIVTWPVRVNGTSQASRVTQMTSLP
jgi:hypothetical protein